MDVTAGSGDIGASKEPRRVRICVCSDTELTGRKGILLLFFIAPTLVPTVIKHHCSELLNDIGLSD